MAATDRLQAPSAPPHAATDMVEQVTAANRVYFDTIADSYDQDPRQRYGLFAENTRRRLRAVIDSHRADIGRGLAVNIGCGTGNMLDLMQALLPGSCGFDISPEMAALARRHTPRVLVADLNHLPFPRGSVSFAAMFGVLHHVYDHVRFFCELREALMPRGVFYADYDPNYYAVRRFKEHWLLGRLWAAVEWYSALVKRVDARVDERTLLLAEYYDLKEFGLRAEALAQALREAGFTDIAVIPHSDGPSLDEPARGRLPHKAMEWLLRLTGEADYGRRAKNLAVMARKP